MNEKVILISIDGMRPDGAVGCGHPFVQELMEKSTYTLQGGSVPTGFPVNLPGISIRIFPSFCQGSGFVRRWSLSG